VVSVAGILMRSSLPLGVTVEPLGISRTHSEGRGPNGVITLEAEMRDIRERSKQVTKHGHLHI